MTWKLENAVELRRVASNSNIWPDQFHPITNINFSVFFLFANFIIKLWLPAFPFFLLHFLLLFLFLINDLLLWAARFEFGQRSNRCQIRAWWWGSNNQKKKESVLRFALWLHIQFYVIIIILITWLFFLYFFLLLSFAFAFFAWFFHLFAFFFFSEWNKCFFMTLK